MIVQSKVLRKPGSSTIMFIRIELRIFEADSINDTDREGNISSCHMLIDKALSSDKPSGHWFEADWLHCKRDALFSNRKVDGSRLTGSTHACHS